MSAKITEVSVELEGPARDRVNAVLRGSVGSSDAIQWVNSSDAIQWVNSSDAIQWSEAGPKGR